MKTTRTLLIAVIGVLMLTPALLADVEIGAQLRITPRPRADLEVYVWPDRGMDGVYYPGENINVNVEVTRDAFLILYNIDSRGNMRILFPSAPWEDNFVQAGDVISFPRSYDDYDWTIEGPAGTEYIQAIASEIPISMPEWPVYLQSVGSTSYIAPEMRNFRAGSDRYHYIDIVNRNICGRYYDWCATDVATFQVRSYPRYLHSYDYDPWPDVFYGEVYIGWPIGSRIYVDNIYIGVAPCWIPRHYTGRRVITCYDGNRLIRRHEVNCFSKRDYYSNNRFGDSRGYVYKKGRWDADDHFRYEKSSDKRNRYRVYDRDDDRWDDDDDRGRYKSSTRGGYDDDDRGSRVKNDDDDRRNYNSGKSNGKDVIRLEKRADNANKSNFKIVKPSTKSAEVKSSSKSDAARAKRTESNGTSNFKVLKQPISASGDAKRTTKSETANAKRAESVNNAKAAPARVENSGRSNDTRASVESAKRTTTNGKLKIAASSKSDAAKAKSSAKGGKGSSSKRTKGGT